MTERSGMFRALAIDEELDGVDLRVFLYLAGVLDFKNFTRVEQRNIAEALGRHPQHISRSIGKLRHKRIILEAQPKVGRSSSYVLNPKFET